MTRYGISILLTVSPAVSLERQTRSFSGSLPNGDCRTTCCGQSRMWSRAGVSPTSATTSITPRNARVDTRNCLAQSRSGSLAPNRQAGLASSLGTETPRLLLLTYLAAGCADVTKVGYGGFAIM